MGRARASFAGCQAILWALVFFMVLPAQFVLADENVNQPDDDESTAPRLYFEPIAGLTTTRHLAPGQTAMPLGTVLELFLEVPADAQVTFSGATVTSRNADGVKATCLLENAGPAIIAAISTTSDGTRHMAMCRLDVVSIAISDITATVTTPTVAPFDLDEYATNADTMSAYFGESIADLVETTTLVSGAVGIDGGRPRSRPVSATRRFRTSTSRRINFQADVTPQVFAPIMEWRVDGLATALGAELKKSFTSVGAHDVSVGPPNRPIGVIIDTYSVSITSHDSGADIVPQGEWITFEAVTDPPGLESGINWVSSTKYGTASPVLGRGPTFTVQFNDTFGPHEETGEPFEWLGVRADNALFAQDQKPALRIDSFTPTSGGSGTILTVSGEGFGDDPCDICAISGNGFAVRGRDIFEGTFTGTVSPIPSSAGPSKIMMVRGSGEFVVLVAPP
ncbi:MAG: hypothetical protein IH987_19900, partial [Planctomycetes bacterium]|nr:hypothetical protein [Planctomycetota bacterium]